MQTYISHVDIYAASGLLRDGALLLDGTQIAGVFPEDRPDLAEKADQEIEDANRDQDEEESNPPTPPTKTGKEWIYEKLEEVVDSAREFWW